MPTIMTKPTNITKLNCMERSCLQVCNIEDVKVIYWICVESELICCSKVNKHRNEIEK